MRKLNARFVPRRTQLATNRKNSAERKNSSKTVNVLRKFYRDWRVRHRYYGF